MITTPQGFDLQGQEPLEGKTVQANEAARLAITTATKYDGLTVYQVDTTKTWQWQGTPVAGAWVQAVLDGFATTNFVNTSAGVGDAGKPIILDATGKIDATMLSASDLSLYYLLDGTRPLTGVMDAGAFKLANLGVGTVSGDAVAYQQLSSYLLTSGTAADSTLLGGQTASYYRNASNINAGTIADTYLPASISSNITGNAATSTTAGEWTTARLLTLTGGATGVVSIKGNAAMALATTVLAGNVSGGATAYNRNFTSSGGTNGTAVTVSRGDHTHPGLGTGITVGTVWKNQSNVDTYGKYTSGYLTETGAWFAMSGSITEATLSPTDAVQFAITLVYQMDPLESTGYIFQIIAGDATGGIDSGGTGTGNTTAYATLGGPPGAYATFEIRDVFTNTQLDTVVATIV